MNGLRSLFHIATIVLVAFLAVTGFLGGVGIVTGVIPLVAEQLAGSPFKDYTLPGLALALVVGGSAAVASILLIRRSRFALLAATTSGVAIMFFEFVEVLVIGSPPGPARFMQLLYHLCGTLIVVLSMGSWLLDLRSED